MNNIFSFFLNALKAIIFSPFYLIFFLLCFILTLINHIVSELCVLFSGFKYGSKKENKYTQLLNKIKSSQAGDQL